MGPVATAVAEPKTSSLWNRRTRIALGIGALAVVWFMLLSNWLGVKPGTPIMMRSNVLFDSDTNLWIGRMIGNDRSVEQTVHPLELVFWRYPCRALAHLARLFMPVGDASVFGPRLMVALFAGAGVGFLAFLALYLGVGPTQGILLFAVYLLFTSSVTIALPEHFGISNGLLCVAFVVLVVVANERLRNSILAALAVLCGGTSLLNVVFPVYCLFESVVKSARLRLRLLLVAIPAGLGAAVVLYHISGTIHRFFDYLATFRLIYHPLQALVYSVYMLVSPAVGGIPFLKPSYYGDPPQWQMVSYDPKPRPLDFSYYFGIQGIGAILWLVLLARCVHIGFRDTQTRPYVQMGVVWVLFNLIFYNIWGREPLLFAPAWSWTLMALVLLGARHLSRTFIAAMVLPIAVCQVVTLREIVSLLRTINP